VVYHCRQLRAERIASGAAERMRPLLQELRELAEGFAVDYRTGMDGRSLDE
jgi:hypothetical protein